MESLTRKTYNAQSNLQATREVLKREGTSQAPSSQAATCCEQSAHSRLPGTEGSHLHHQLAHSSRVLQTETALHRPLHFCSDLCGISSQG